MSMQLKDFQIDQLITKTSCTALYLASKVGSGEICVLKVFSNEEIKEEGREKQLRRELNLHSRLNHPRILHLEGFFYDRDYTIMVLEWAPMWDLYQEIELGKVFREEQIRAMTKHVAEALQYCHSLGIIHRDLKAENVFVFAQDQYKLGDLGWAVCEREETPRLAKYGTIDYMAPELVSKQTYSTPIDCWALGCLIFECFTGKTPFYAEEVPETYEKIKRVEWSWPEHLQVSSNARDLVDKLLQFDPKQRLTATQILEHPFILHD